jgi:hypothetical protein
MRLNASRRCESTLAHRSGSCYRPDDVEAWLDRVTDSREED